ILFINPEPAPSGPNPICSTQGANSPCTAGERNVEVSQSRLAPSSSAENSSAPRVRKRRKDLLASLNPALDQSSVPSSPKANSAFLRNSSTVCDQAPPSPTASRSNSSTLAG